MFKLCLNVLLFHQKNKDASIISKKVLYDVKIQMYVKFSFNCFF